MKTSVREMTAADAENVVDYFVKADPKYLKGMGAEKSKLPDRDKWIDYILGELSKPYDQKDIYYVIWQVEGRAIGHSNINKIEFGKKASMHLHIWNKEDRQFGNGLALLKKTIPYYFEKFSLEKLLCEPYAENPAPKRVLAKVGFDFIRTFESVPSIICFEQKVNQFELSHDTFVKCFGKTQS